MTFPLDTQTLMGLSDGWLTKFTHETKMRHSPDLVGDSGVFDLALCISAAFGLKGGNGFRQVTLHGPTTRLLPPSTVVGTAIDT